MIDLQQLTAYTNKLLAVHRFTDYCPNGLQIEAGSNKKIQRIVAGVTACQQLIAAATDLQADLLLVHHGFFWRNEAAVITGYKARRIRSLIQAGIHLLAYHLPLDFHAELGNNIALARQLDIQAGLPLLDAQGKIIGLTGTLARPVSAADFARNIGKKLHREPLHVGDIQAEIQTLAWCTGAGQHFIDQALLAGVDAYLSGEISESTVHFARENNLHYFAAGHHATEMFGVQRLGEHLAEKFALEYHFVNIPNPV